MSASMSTLFLLLLTHFKGFPDSIGVTFLPDHQKLSMTVLDRGLNTFLSRFWEDIRVIERDDCVQVATRCYRSMKKSMELLHVDTVWVDIHLILFWTCSCYYFPTTTLINCHFNTPPCTVSCLCVIVIRQDTQSHCYIFQSGSCFQPSFHSRAGLHGCDLLWNCSCTLGTSRAVGLWTDNGRLETWIKTDQAFKGPHNGDFFFSNSVGKLSQQESLTSKMCF